MLTKAAHSSPQELKRQQARVNDTICNTRILRPLARRLRAWSYYFHNLVIWTHNHLNRIYHSLSLTLTLSRDLSLSLTSLTGSPSPPSPLSSRLRNLPFQLDSKAKGASLGVGNHLLQVFHLGATSFSSFLARGASSRYYKLGLADLVVLGCSR